MKEYLDNYFSNIIENRVVKEWIPTLHAPEDVVADYPVIAGLTVTIDRFCDPRSMELRVETGKLMVCLNGIRPREI